MRKQVVDFSALLGFFNPEGIGDAPDGAIGGDQHDIKAHPRCAMAGIGGKPSLGGSDQTCALARAKRESRFGEGGPGLDFDEGEQPFAFGDQVNLPGFGTDSLAEQRPALGGKGLGSQRFRIFPSRIGAPAAQKAMGGWGFVGHGA
jgi:hypothetical protein